jgi:hypothetical protein
VLSIPLANLLPPIRRACRNNTSWLGQVVVGVTLVKSASFFLLFLKLGQETKARLAKSSDIRKYRWKVGVRNTQPRGQGSAVLVDGNGWYPTAARVVSAIRVVRTVGGERRENGSVGAGDAIKIAAEHGTAHDELLRTPRMIRPERPVGDPGPRKIG